MGWEKIENILNSLNNSAQSFARIYRLIIYLRDPKNSSKEPARRELRNLGDEVVAEMKHRLNQ